MTEGSTLSLKTQERPYIQDLYFSVSFFGHNVEDNQEGEFRGRQEKLHEDKENVIDSFWEGWKDWQDWQDWKNKNDKKDKKDTKDWDEPEDWEEGSAFADQFPTDSLTQNS